MSIVVHPSAKEVVARDVEHDGLAGAWQAAQHQIDTGAYRHAEWQVGAVCVTRTDQTLEARRAKWEADFYDRDVNDRRIRRFKRPQIERDWEAWAKAERKAKREAQQLENDTFKQRR